MDHRLHTAIHRIRTAIVRRDDADGRRLRHRLKSGMRFLAPLLTGAALMVMLHEGGRLIRVEWLAHFALWIPVALLIRSSPRYLRLVPLRVWPGCALMLSLWLALVSKWIHHRWFFFLHWTQPIWPESHPVHPVLLLFILLTVVVTPLVFLRPRWTPWLLGLALILCMALAMQAVQQQTEWALLTRDDHPSFAFRIWKFMETFPRLRSYTPYWNGGAPHSFGPESGVPGPALFMSPFLLFFSVENAYTPLVAALFIVGVPALAVLSAKLMGSGWTGGLAAGLIALCISQFYHLWLLTYGTIGANLSAAFAMPACACLYRVVNRNVRTWQTGVLLTIAGVFTTLWPPGALTALVISLGFLLQPRQWTWPKWKFLLICAAMVALVQFRYYRVLLEAHVLGFLDVEGPSLRGGAGTDWLDFLRKGGQWLQAHFRQANPALLFLGLGGTLFPPRRDIRSFFAPIIIGFALLTAFGPETVSALQLQRAIFPLLFAALLPAAATMAFLLRNRSRKTALIRASLAALLMLGGWNAVRLWNNEGRQRYSAISPEYRRMVDFIRHETPEGSRLLFADRTVHAYGGGHITFLPVMTGREMMASDFYHFDPKHVPYDYPPKPWRQSAEQLDEFYRLYNVSMVTTFHDHWKDFFRKHTEHYEERATFWDGGIAFFKVRNAPGNAWIKGSGTITARFNRIEAQIDDGIDEAVLSYNWDDQLRTEHPAELFPYEAGPGVTLIGVRPNGKHHVVIRY